MANLTSTLTVRLIDAVTGPARAAANSIRGIGRAVDQTNTRRMAIAGSVSTMSRDLGRASRDLSRHVSRMSTGLSVPAGFATWFGARSVYDFERMLNNFQAVTLATEEQREAIKAHAKELNYLFPYNNEQIIAAAFELGRAGFNFEQIMGSLKDTLNLALAGDIELQEAADIATNVLTAMRLPMKTAEQSAESLRRVNDALSYAATSSNTDVRMMGDTLKYVGPMAAAAGMDIEQVAAASIVMAKNGIRASEAGVAMRSALVRMVRPTKPMLTALRALGVEVDDFVKRGRQISAQDIIGSLALDGVDASSYATEIEDAIENPELKSSLAGLTNRIVQIVAQDASVVDKSKLAETVTDALTLAGSEVDFFGFLEALKEKGADLGDIARIFDARQGARLITLLSGDLIGTLAEVRENAAGVTDRMARIRTQGVVGEWMAFKAALDSLFQAIAEAGVLKTATEFIRSITEGLKSLAASNPELLETGTYLIIIAGAVGPLGMLLGGVASGFLAILAIFRMMKAAGLFVAGVGAAGVLGGGGAAAAGGAAAGSAAAGAAAGAAAKGGLRKGAGLLGRGAGAIGIGLLVLEALGFLDPKGNLWGLTSGIDKWVKERFGFNMANLGDRPAGPTIEAARAMNIAKLEAKQAELDEALRQLEANVPSSMRDQPNPFRDRLLAERAQIEAQINEARAAGQDTGAAFIDGLQAEFRRAKEVARQEMQKLKQEIESTTIRPVILPSVEVPGLRGVHADTGVE